MNSNATFFGALNRREQYQKHPVSGEYLPYTDYREVTAEDCKNRCVYCDSHEDTIGGREAMQLDHFRPWNKGFGPEKERRFKHLKDDPTNLVHSCAVCNRFKAARWPTEDPSSPHDNEKGWIDPFAELRSDYLVVDANGEVAPGKPLGGYLIATLRLNRPLLRRQRELRNLIALLEGVLVPRYQHVLNSNSNSEHAQAAQTILALISTIRSQCCPE